MSNPLAAGLSCALSALGCLLLCALRGFPAQESCLLWAALWAAAWAGGYAFARGPRRTGRGWHLGFGALFALAAALGLRLDAAGETGWAALAMALGAALCFAPAVGQAALRLDGLLASLAPGPQARGRRVLPVSMGCMLAAWLPYLLAYYPGIHAYDTFAQIPEYLSGSFSTHHPLLHTLITGWLYDLGGLMGSHELGMLMYSLAQMALVAYALARGLAELARTRCPRWVRLVLLAFFCLVPQYPLHAIGCTKDIPFAAFLVLLILRLMRLIREPDCFSPRWAAGTAAVLALAVLFRNNAPYALLLFLPFAVWLAGRGRRRRMALLLAAGLALGLGAGKGLQLATGAESGLINEMLSVPAQQLSRVYVYHGQTDPVGWEIVEFVPYAESYDEWSADRVKLHLKVSRPGELWGFIKFWVREFFHYPIEYIDAFLYQCKGYWHLDDALYAERPGAIFLWFYDDLGMEQRSLLPWLKDAMQTLFSDNAYRGVPLLSLLTQPAFYTWLCLFALACGLRRRDRALCAGALCALCYLATLCLGPMVNNRYSFCVTAAAPLLIGFLCAHNFPPAGETSLRR